MFSLWETMQTTLALPTKNEKVPSLNKRQSQSGSLAYGKISDNATEQNIDDYKKMQNIRVIARFRPKNKREVRWSKLNNIQDKPPSFISSQQVSLEPLSSSSSNNNQYQSSRSTYSIDFGSSNNNGSFRNFNCSLDSVLNQQYTQKQVFYLCGLPMIMACLDGYNATIFAYGQSGSGKTYTMMGPENNVKSADDFGLVPRCIIYLFQKLDERLSQNGGKLQDYIVNIELLQIYKSQLLDLLNPKSKKKLVIKTNFSTDSVFVQNLRSVQIQTVEEAFKLLTNAQQNRIVAGHSLNEVSSRSHMLITMTVIQRSIDGTLKTSKLNFGDLAGSEDLTKALGRNPDPERKKEAIAINQSLSALTTAVSYLSRGQKPGFRDSPLTHILKDSLGGNSKTIMLVTVSPHIYNRTETIRTLRFASTAKKVKNKAKINEEKSIIALKKRIKELERENGKLRQDLISKTKKVKHAKKNSRKDAKQLITGNNGNGNMVEIKENDEDDDRRSVILHTDNDDEEIDVESDQKTMEKNPNKSRKRKASVASSSGSINDVQEDEWGSDSDNDEMVNHHLENNMKNGNSSDDSEDESNFELNEYIQQLNEYREKLDREGEENETLQLKIDEKNLELESCTNKISELIDELNQNEQDFYDSKAKINHLQGIISSYRQQYPSFKPEMHTRSQSVCESPSQFPLMSTEPITRRSTISSSMTTSNTSNNNNNNNNNNNQPLLVSMPDDYDIVPDLVAQNSLGNLNNPFISNHSSDQSLHNNGNGHHHMPRPSLSRRDTVIHQTNLLQNLLTLHQRMESKMKETESALNALRGNQSLSRQSSNNPFVNNQVRHSLQLMATNSLQPITSNHSTPTTDLNKSNLSMTNVNSNKKEDNKKNNNNNNNLEVVNDASSTLIYESADEKLSEWDLDVSTGRDSEVLTNETNITNVSNKKKVNLSKKKLSKSNRNKKYDTIDDKENSSSPPVDDIDTFKNAKQLRQHLQTLSKNEKRLKRDLAEKLKADARSALSTGWCQCWFTKPKKDQNVASQLIEEYLKMKVRKELVKDKYQRKKEKTRAKALKKRIKNNAKGKPILTDD